MRALVREGDAVEVREIPAPQVRRPGDVVVRVLAAAICRTDLYVADGRIASANPITLGHELCGVVTDSASGTVAVGDLVTVDPRSDSGFIGVDRHGAFADYIRVEDSLVHRLPPGCDPLRGAYTEPVAAALAVLEAGIEPGERGTVYGDTRFSRLTRRILVSAGIDELMPCGAERGLDFAVETSGTAGEIQLLLACLRPGGTLVVKRRTRASMAQPAPHEGFDVRVVDYGSFERAVQVISGDLVLEDLFGECFELEEFGAAFETAASDESQKQFFRIGNRACVG